MANKTLLELRTATRRRADQESSTFITDAELNTYLNASATELLRPARRKVRRLLHHFGRLLNFERQLVDGSE
jgi:hypothetical protein